MVAWCLDAAAMVGEPAAAIKPSSSRSNSSSGAHDAASDCWNQLFTLCEQNTLLGRWAGVCGCGGVGMY